MVSMPYTDLREFIEKLKWEGELAEISAEVDWRYEIGGIVRKNLDLKGPALLFKKINDTLPIPGRLPTHFWEVKWELF
jgi:UbiD family decarboxylase